MQTRIDEIADNIFRLSTFTPDLPPVGFTFNQYLIRADDKDHPIRVEDTREEGNIMDFLEENTWLGQPDYLDKEEL